MLAAKGCLLALLWSACWLIAGVLASVSLAAHADGGLVAAFVVWAAVPVLALGGWLWGRVHP